MEENNINITKINDLTEYIRIIDELGKTYPVAPIMDSPIATKMLFRGICNTEYPLLPRILHIDAHNEEGHKIQNSKYTAFEEERNIIRQFQAEALFYINNLPIENLYQWAEYAQHYGVPTRFLDWTSNPLVALYFACRDNKNKTGAVWMLHIINYRNFLGSKTEKKQSESSKVGLTIGETINNLINGQPEIDYPIIYTPRYSDPRMSAQASYFMVWGSKEEALEVLIHQENYMIYEKHRESIRTYNKNQQQHVLFKIEINGYDKQSLFRQLDMLGINEKTLFPGLDGIGRYMEMKYRFDYYEAVDCL